MSARRFVDAGAAAGVALGLWVSLHYAFATWTTESDAANPFLLWEGVRQYGPGFLTTFHYSSDAWLTWPMPLLFAAFATFGAAPPVAFAVGWLLFVGSAGTVFLVARRAAGTRPALACAIVLLLSNREAIGELGFLTYPVSHNGPLLLGLLALHAAMRWMEERRWASLAVVTVALAAAGLGDPWTELAFSLPLLGAAAVLGLASPGKRRTAVTLMAAVAAALLVDHTRLFGLLWFLPSPPLAFGEASHRLRDIEWLGRIGAMWFNLAPNWGDGYGWVPDGWQTAADLAPLALAAVAVAALAAGPARRSTAFALLWLTGLGSIAAVCSAFVLFDLPPVISMGRLFAAAYVLGLAMAAAAAGRAWDGLRRPWRAMLAGYAGLLALSGLASAPGCWASLRLDLTDDGLRHYGPNVPPFTNGIPQFAAFLQAHGLHYGYGAYWLVQASAVGWVTHGAVQVRPVFLAPGTGVIAPFFAQISPEWYTAADGPAGDPATFLALTPGFLGCQDIPRCTSQATQQFGPPQAKLSYEDTTILVWDHRLFGAVPP